MVLLHMAGCYVNVGFEFCANKSADASKDGIGAGQCTMHSLIAQEKGQAQWVELNGQES